MLSLLIPGKNSPGKDIDVYLHPLVEELKELWVQGVETFDVSTKKNFQMHVVVLWTINDFPAHGDLSGWSTKGYMACPVCNDQTYSQGLRNMDPEDIEELVISRMPEVAEVENLENVDEEDEIDDTMIDYCSSDEDSQQNSDCDRESDDDYS